MSDYAEFLARKAITHTATGIENVPALSDKLKPFQSDITRWALQKGRCAIFADCGLGKSWMAIEYARVVAEHTGKPSLILTPLAVAQQFVREGDKLGVEVTHLRDPAAWSDGEWAEGVYVLNYQRLHLFEGMIRELGCVVLDESGILKNSTGKTRDLLISTFKHTPFRLCCSATPAPNDSVELGSHSEFLGVMRHIDMLQRFFEHDAGDTGDWVLKGHGRKPFWRWVGQWSKCVGKPSDMGYADDGYDLPPLEMHEHVVDVDKAMAHKAGLLFAFEASTLSEQRAVKRSSLAARVELAASIANASDEQWIVWAELNDESKALAKAIRGAVEVCGSDSLEAKEQAVVDFLDGKTRVLVTKKRMLAHGLNAQCCSHQLDVGVDHSFEAQYQALRRSWRFGQTRTVHAHYVCTSADGRVVHNLKRKQAAHEAMHRELVEAMRDAKAMQQVQG